MKPASAAPRNKPSMNSSEFAGFPEQGFRFLRQLKQHNDRDWFRERKQDYVQHVEEPMGRLMLSVAETCRKRGIDLQTRRKNPVMRVYRDIRFSKDKRPFKTHVGADLRRSFTDSECLLYVHLSPDESFTAAGVWQPARDLLQAWRKAMVHDPARFEKMIWGLKRGKLELSEQHTLSGMPRGLAQYSCEPIGRWLKLTSFVVHRPLTTKECASPDLVKTVVGFAMESKPLFEFAWEVEAGFTPTSRKRIQESELV
jgi:uncharacterized protein (TIGR02453 family)